jgi:hypothetical protein
MLLVRARAAIAASVLVGLSAGSSACTFTIIAATPYDQRKSSQYWWLAADAVGAASTFTAYGIVSANEQKSDVAPYLLVAGVGFVASMLFSAMLGMPPEKKPPSQPAPADSDASTQRATP